MDDQALPRSGEPDEPEASDERDASMPPLPKLPDAVNANAEKVRRLIDQGASSPEELRLLAEQIREHRALEDSAWKTEVRPALRKAKKGTFDLGHLRDRPADQPSGDGARIALVVVVVVAALVLAATQSSVLWVLIPVVGVLLYAYRQGRAAHDAPTEDEPPA